MSIHEPPPSGRQRVLGRKVGPIRITDWLADGGMGEVYLGWDERLERQVALKAVRRQRLDDRATDEARARLLREARILSRLDDPKICQIHDYIEGDDGDWLVLEWVDGDTLSDIDLDTVSRARRLEIAQHIAEVLVETHAQGIVHRDLKPSNVMLARDGAVKVLDFGVARWSAMEIGSAVPKRGAGLPVVEGEPSRPDIETRFGDLLGTILYMSPEQARGELVTPASDLYAFGLLLGEMLTGEPPYPPDLPATAVLVRVARGERPDARRHADALGPDMVRLIDDLTRVDPAARPTAGETVRRLSWERGRPKRRWRRGLATAAAVAAMVVATVYTLGLRATWSDSLTARIAAERACTDARELSTFMVDLFSVPASERRSAVALTARGILDRGADRIDREFEQRPRLRARLALQLGQVYQSLGAYDRSRQLIEASLHLRRRARPADALAIAESLDGLGWAHRYGGDLAAAEQHFAEALALREATLGPMHRDVAETLNGLAVVERRQGRFEEAEAHYLRSLAIVEALDGPEHPVVASRLNNLALLYYYQGDLDRAEAMHRRSLAIRETAFETHHPSLANSLNNLANVLVDRGRTDEAEALYRRALEIWRHVGGPQHPQTAASAENLGYLFEDSGRWDEAEIFYLEALEVRRRAFAAGHPDIARALANVGGLDVLRRRLESGEARLREALAAQEAAYGPDDLDVAVTLTKLAAASIAQGRIAEGRALAGRALTINRAALGDDHPAIIFCLYTLALCDLADGDTATAIDRLDRAITIGQAGDPDAADGLALLVVARKFAERPPGSRGERLDFVRRMTAPGRVEESPAWAPDAPTQDQRPAEAADAGASSTNTNASVERTNEIR